MNESATKNPAPTSRPPPTDLFLFVAQLPLPSVCVGIEKGELLFANQLAQNRLQLPAVDPREASLKKLFAIDGDWCTLLEVMQSPSPWCLNGIQLRRGDGQGLSVSLAGCRLNQPAVEQELLLVQVTEIANI